MYYSRETYLQKIRGFYHDNDLIKVITGVRRCGKSCLMHTIADELQAQGVPDEQLHFFDLDKRGYRNIRTPEQLDRMLADTTHTAEQQYLFIDEIQNVSGFEEVINSYREEGNLSIFITGSNSYLLSGELVTKLTGRYITFELFPLNFEEYLGMKRFLGKSVSANLTEDLDHYILEGGFPKALTYDNLRDKRIYTASVVSEIFEKDIRRRVKVRNRDAFERVQRYLINNFGATVSFTNILKDLEKAGLRMKRETLHRYVEILKDAKILYECPRFDLKSRRSIRGEQKYYLADLSFYYLTNADNRIQYGPVLENIVYLYSRAKDYSVSIGRIGKFECDFILRNPELLYRYLQVAMTVVSSEATEEREYRPLEAISDNYPKYIATRNDPIQRRGGIIHVNIPEFLANGKLW